MAVNQSIKPSVAVLPYPADTAPARCYYAILGAEGAFYPGPIKGFPKAGLHRTVGQKPWRRKVAQQYGCYVLCNPQKTGKVCCQKGCQHNSCNDYAYGSGFHGGDFRALQCKECWRLLQPVSTCMRLPYCLGYMNKSPDKFTKKFRLKYARLLV